MSIYAIKGKPAILVDMAYFQLVQSNSELYEYLVTHGVEQWDGYADAEQEYNNDMDTE